MPNFADELSRLRSILTDVRRRSLDIYLALVVNTQSAHSLSQDYSRHSVLTEFLSDIELDEILTGFRDNGIYVEVFLGEAEFMKALANGEVQRRSFKYKVVYGTVPSGTWHGRDALIPAVCGAYELPFCGCNAYTMSLIANKFYAFTFARSLGHPVPRCWLYDTQTGWIKNNPPPLGLRVIAKPMLECASIGIDDRSVFDYDKSSESHLDEYVEVFQQPFILQEFIPGYEIEVPVMSFEKPFSLGAMGIKLDGDPLLGNRILSYDLIYEDAYEFYNVAEDRPELAQQLKTTASTVYANFGMSGLTRVDFRVREDGEFYITDINTIPHLTQFSSCAASFDTVGMSHRDLMGTVLALGLYRTDRIKSGTRPEYP